MSSTFIPIRAITGSLIMCLELGLVFVAASTSASHLFGSALPFFPLILATWSLVIFVLISELTEWHWQRVAARGDTGPFQERLKKVIVIAILAIRGHSSRTESIMNFVAKSCRKSPSVINGKNTLHEMRHSLRIKNDCILLLLWIGTAVLLT